MYRAMLFWVAMLCACRSTGPPPPPVRLSVNDLASSLEIRWDRKSASKRGNAVLRIHDSGREHRVALDEAHLAFGAVSYRSQSGDIRVDFEVDGRVIDSVRVVGRASVAEPRATDEEGPDERSAADPPVNFRLAPRDVRRIAPPSSTGEASRGR